MKKILSLLIACLFFAGVMSFQSCQKCLTCSYTYTVAGQTQTYDYAELCGSNSDINDYEDACATAAAIYGVNCNCAE